MTFGLLVGTLYATLSIDPRRPSAPLPAVVPLSIGQDVHIHAVIAAEQRSSVHEADPIHVPRIIDITAAAAGNPELLGSAVGLEPGELIVAVNDLRFGRSAIPGGVPVFALIGATPGSYLDLTVRRADSREDRILVLVH